MKTLLKTIYQAFILSVSHENQSLKHFCKSIRAHKTQLGLFIQYNNAEVLNVWIHHLSTIDNVSINKESDFSATLIFNIEPSNSSIFSLIQSWQNAFEHDAFVYRQNDTLSTRLTDANTWIHSWMSEYLLSVTPHTDTDFPNHSLQTDQIIHAMGLQQNIKQPLSSWLQQDDLWWQNIPPSALALSLLSHNYLDKRDKPNPSTPLKIKYELLTSTTILNPKVKLEQLSKQLLQDKQNQIRVEKSDIHKLFLNFEIECLNACTFFKPYKLLYALFEFERSFRSI
ncbi:hypothetical protein [Marinicellulosiphila megalodicopiae]|uniref:hypothetical protein n=1 Tax=Marinicellulosiphila megalodicopiae TaxID=2724896 RepID=UPI003BB08EF5